MIYPKIEDCIVKADHNKYVLTAMVSKRAKDLIAHSMGQNMTGKEKQISLAMREVVDGKIMPTTTASKNAH